MRRRVKRWRHDAVLSASVTALYGGAGGDGGADSRGSDERLKELARRSQVCWRLMSVPGVGPIVALAFMAAIEDVGRFRRMRDIGVYLGLTPRRYQSGETDVVLGISQQGDAMARHYLYEAANVLLDDGAARLATQELGPQALKRCGPKRARVAVARKLAALLGHIWKDGTHFDAVPA